MTEKFRSAIMAVIVNEKNQILIGSSPRDGGYKFPQGGIDPQENIFLAIKRELKEELDFNLDEKNILYISDKPVRYYYPKWKIKNVEGHIGQEQFVFKIKYCGENLIPQDNEFENLIWIEPKDLNKYDTLHRKEAYLLALKLCNLI